MFFSGSFPFIERERIHSAGIQEKANQIKDRRYNKQATLNLFQVGQQNRMEVKSEVTCVLPSKTGWAEVHSKVGWHQSKQHSLSTYQRGGRKGPLRRAPIPKHNKERALGKGNEGCASARKHAPDTQLLFGDGVPKDARATLPWVEAAGRAGGHFTPAPIPAAVLDTCPAIPACASRRPKTKKEANRPAPWHCQGLLDF